jgi:hypothetical protein
MIPLTLVLVKIGLGGGKAEQNAGALVARSLLDAVKQPVVWLPIIGAVLALCGVHTRRVLELSFNLIGQAAAGVALFALGLILHGQHLRIDRDIALNALMKNVGQPAVLFGLTVLFGIHGAPARISADLIVWAAGIKASPILATLDGLPVGKLGQLVVRSTLQSQADDAVFALGDCADCPGPRWTNEYHHARRPSISRRLS